MFFPTSQKFGPASEKFGGNFSEVWVRGVRSILRGCVAAQAKSCPLLNGRSLHNCASTEALITPEHLHCYFISWIDRVGMIADVLALKRLLPCVEKRASQNEETIAEAKKLAQQIIT